MNTNTNSKTVTKKTRMTMSLNEENPGQKSKVSCVSASPKSKGALARQGKSRESSFHETFVSHSLKQALIVTMCQIFKYLIK